MSVAPSDLPQIRSRAIKYVREWGVDVYKGAIESDIQTLYPRNLAPEDAAAHLCGAEVVRLEDAELFYVTAPMMQLADVAARSLPEYQLTQQDLPAPTGLMFFAEPIKTMPDFRHPADPSRPVRIEYVAVTWGWWHGGTTPGFWVTWWSDARRFFDDAIANGNFEGELREQTLKACGRIVIDSESVFDIDVDGSGRDEIEQRSSELMSKYPKGQWEEKESERRADLHAKFVLRTLWTLMQQPITSDDTLEPSRADRRRLTRRGIDAAPVRVIGLRRGPSSSGTDGDSSREYRHRWLVRGHWKQQWYPGRQVHRPIWIAPHIKGPDGAPLLGGEKVYALRR